MDETGEWQQICLTDPYGLSGESVRTFVAFLIEVSQAQWVEVRGVAGSFAGLRDREGGAIPVSEFLTKVADAIQYDWAFFYFNMVPIEKRDGAVNYIERMHYSDVTVRLADDEYVYVYTKNKNICSEITNKYPKVEYKICKFDDLEVLF